MAEKEKSLSILYEERRPERSRYPGMKRVPIQAQAATLPDGWRPNRGRLLPPKRISRLTCRIARERFEVEVNDGVFYIRHPVWSLVGSGGSLAEAEVDIRKEASELVEVMSQMPAASLDYEAMRLYRFVLRVG